MRAVKLNSWEQQSAVLGSIIGEKMGNNQITPDNLKA